MTATTKQQALTEQQALLEYTLRLADNTLIIGHRLSEWCGHGPFLEEDIGVINTALDLLGQARLFYNYAGELEGKDRDEDDFVYRRDERQWRNCLIMEQPIGDFAYTTVRQFLVDSYHFYLYKQLQHSNDKTIAAIAAKALKETRFHLRHSSEWVLRLGDGTEESHQRTQKALNEIWHLSDELFRADAIDAQMVAQGIGADLQQLRANWQDKVTQVITQATLICPADEVVYARGREGYHSEHMGVLLAQMQFVQRAYPGLSW